LIRLLIDMNLSTPWVQQLNDAGHDAMHWSSVGDPQAPDREICAYARARGLVVLTNDLDFPQILALTGTTDAVWSSFAASLWFRKHAARRYSGR
jgi:predicted nuclease of predicted toxin-antitoxin system